MPDLDAAAAPARESSRQGVARSARVIALATLGSRLLGTVRDILTAQYFGAGYLMDAFVIAFLVPNLFRRLLGEGALSAAFLPVYTGHLENKSRDEADRMASAVMGTVGLLLIALVAVGVCGALLYDMSSVADSKRQLVARLTAILLPYMLFICLTAICQAVLNAHRHFLMPALGPLVLNVFWIAGLWMAGPDGARADWTRIGIVAGWILLGGMAQLAMQFPAMRRHGFRFSWRPDFRHPGLRQVGLLLLPMVVGVGVVQINSVMDNVIAEWLVPGDGAVSHLYYANRLMQFPLAIVGIAMAVAVFPVFSRHYARRDMAALQNECAHALQTTFLVAMPASVGLAIVAEPLIQMLFGRGEFLAGEGDPVQRQTWVVIAYAMGVWAHCLGQVLIRVFYAMEDSRSPFRVSVYMVAANFALNLLLVPWFAEAGLALATSLCGMANLLILYWMLRKKIDFSLGPEFWRQIRMSALHTAFMAAACWGVIAGLGTARLAAWYGSTGGKIAAFGCICGSGLLVYLALAWTRQRRELLLLLRR